MFEEKNNIFFHFKHFSVRHHQSSFKVGFDGVLLGAWSNVSDSLAILDIGTGTGLLALMCAQKNADAKITGIEPDRNSFEEAAHNFNNSPWSNRLLALNTTLQLFATSGQYTFDHIISNPPYFSNSLLPGLKPKLIARHTFNLNHSEILKHSSSMLSPNGKLSVILPYPDGSTFIEKASQSGLYPTKITNVITTKSERLLIEFTKSIHTELQKKELKIYNSEGKYSDEYLAIVRDFYLKIG